MNRERTFLLLAIGLTAGTATEADAVQAPTFQPAIGRLESIRSDYLKALQDRGVRDPQSGNVVAQFWPNFPNFPNFPNWANGWRNF
jgi:hypothetical protein